MTLLGSLPLNTFATLDDGRQVFIDEAAIDDWRYTPDLLVPIVFGHDLGRVVGWATKTRVRGHQLYVYGDVDDSRPFGVEIARMIHRHRPDGLSPAVKVQRGARFYADDSWGPGQVLSFPELSVVWEPRIPTARWLSA